MPSSQQPTQRPLHELRGFYTLHPGERDVLVEAPPDAALIRWYLEERGLAATVTDIDSRAEVSADLVLAHGGEVGKRGRLVALARMAAEEWELAQPSLTCVVDADRDYLRPEHAPAAETLLRTDLGTIDVYLLLERPLNQFLRAVLGRAETAVELHERLLPALNDLCVLRSVLHWSGLGVGLIDDFGRCCNFGAGVVTLDAPELLGRSLRGPDRQHLDRLLEEYSELRTALPDDPFRAVRGHDASALIMRALNLNNVWARIEAFEAAWRGCLNAEDLDDFPMFEKLRARLT